MRKLALLLVGAIAVTALPANGAVRVVGSTDAQSCYMAAKAKRANPAAVEICNLALESNLLNRRDMAATKVNRGILQMYERDYTTALADYDEAIALKPDLGEAHVNKAIAMLRLDQRQAAAAIQSLSRGIELGTEEAEVAHYMRGVAYEIVGDAKNAYLDYKKATELKPTWNDPQLALRRFTVTKGAAG